MIYRQRESKAVSAWISDSAYTRGGEVVCGLRHVYRGVWGCPAWAAGRPCSYCFLKGTVQGKTELLKGVAWVDRLRGCNECGRCSPVGGRPIDNARAAVEKWAAQSAESRIEADTLLFWDKEQDRARCVYPDLLNAGEYTDSLGFPPHDNPHVGMLLDLFASPDTNPHGQKVLFVTKAGLEAVKAHLEGREPSENVILSWSVGNAGWSGWPMVHAEPGMPLPHERLNAAWWAGENGWRTRIRIDPILTDPAFVKPAAHGGEVASLLYMHQPEIITLGTLRHRGGRVKLPADERATIYRAAIEGLRHGGYTGPIGLCKETPEMIRDVLDIEPQEMKCNCLP